ncbi:MAG: multidrug transporter [Candidatus Puniceispirillum sp.]|nr:multidrug transporter [Candidatus Puniceispirillum sp.]
MLGVVLTSGCTMAPTYERPVMPVDDAWPTSSAYPDRPALQEAELVSWQAFFKSPILSRLIQDSLANNRDLRVAVLNVEKTRAQYQIQWADLVPSIEAVGSLSRKGTPTNVNASDGGSVRSTYTATVGITSYELDLFGRVRSLTENALETYFATREAQKAAHISLISQVAQGYVDYLAQKKILYAVRIILEAQENAFKLVEARVAQGSASMADLESARGDIENARSTVAQITTQLAQSVNALSLLVGKPLKESDLGSEDLDDHLVQEVLPVNLPSKVLLARPDVMQAEHTLRAAGANIGAARAAFFPTISLTGTAGFSSAELSSLFSSGSRLAWTLAPQINLPIFEGGRTVAGLEVAEADQKIAVADYEKAIQSAFQEVADNLAGLKGGKAQDDAQKNRLSAYMRAYEIAKSRYAHGVASFTDVLVLQQTLLNASVEYVTGRVSYLKSLVTLYKALGGGLDKEETPDKG